MKFSKSHWLWALPAALALALAACGGGGSGGSTQTSGAMLSGASAGATSSGAITAFGSVFVNGHEFDVSRASLIDDDTGARPSDYLEVGQVVDVKPASDSSEAHPIAGELHVHPLVRGYVDAVNTAAGTITVMGQTIQVTSATNFSDHRACTQASSSPCATITGLSGLSATTGSGGSAVAGNYVVVHGYLYASSGSSSANVVATLVTAADVPGSPAPAAFKAEGAVVSQTGSTITIGGLTTDLSSAICRVNQVVTNCAQAYAPGQVVSVFSNLAPSSLPVSTFVATQARLASRMSVETNGATVEMEGGVFSVDAGHSTFVMRGVTVDLSALSAPFTMPSVGDVVRVVGTVSADGQSLIAGSYTLLHASARTSVSFMGDLSSVTPGATAGTYTFTLMGQTFAVNVGTRLADRSAGGWWDHDPDASASKFNISTFQSYLAQVGTSQHVMVNAQDDGTGKFTALSVTIMPPSAVFGVAGIVDAAPPPVNGATTTFSVHGIPVTAAMAAIQYRQSGASSVAAGDFVRVWGAFSGGSLDAGTTLSQTSGVIDLGVPDTEDRDRGGF